MPAADAYAVARELARIRARLDALERSQEGGAETLQPNYLTFDPSAGLVGASFTGLVNALGLIIPTYVSTGGRIPLTNSIIWRSTLSGATTAQIGAEEVVSNDYSTLYLFAQARDQPGNSQVAMDAVDDLGSAWAKLIVYQTNRGANTQILFAVPTSSGGGIGQDVLIDSNLNSRFVQLHSSHKCVIDDNGGNLYRPSANNQANGTVMGVAFNSIHQPWNNATPVGGMQVVIHGTTTATAVPWSYAFTAPNVWTIIVNNNSGFAIDWSWNGVVLGN